MKFAMLVTVAAALVGCSPVSSDEEWREPTEAAISAWNLSHPNAPLSATCADRVRGIRFEIATQDHIDRECPPTDGITASGCTVQFDSEGAVALVLDNQSWRVYAHEAMHVAHGCGGAAWGDMDPHHRDAPLWSRDPSDALHI